MSQTTSSDKYTGSIASTIVAGNAVTFVDIPTNLTLEANELVGGLLRYNGINYAVYSNSGGANASVAIIASGTFQMGAAITAYQDDFSDLGLGAEYALFDRAIIGFVGQPAPNGSVSIGIAGSSLTQGSLAGGFLKIGVQLIPIISNDGSTIIVEKKTGQNGFLTAGREIVRFGECHGLCDRSKWG